jgi:hypothetical protein
MSAFLAENTGCPAVTTISPVELAVAAVCAAAGALAQAAIARRETSPRLSRPP